MEFLRLSLEVSARCAGLTPVNPRVLQGGSGIEHRFGLVFADGDRRYAFDLCDQVTEVDVVKSYAKEIDTGAAVSIVCAGGEVSETAKSLASSYGMQILNLEGASNFFAPQRAAPTPATA